MASLLFSTHRRRGTGEFDADRDVIDIKSLRFGVSALSCSNAEAQRR